MKRLSIFASLLFILTVSFAQAPDNMDVLLNKYTFRVELIAGKTVEVHANNPHFFGGETKSIGKG